MQARPKLRLLDPDQIQRIHSLSIRILEDTGIRVESKRALQVFSNSEGVRIEDHTVYLRKELVNHAIKLAPSEIEVFNKKGEHAFHLGPGHNHETRFGIGCTMEEKQVHLFTRSHMQHCTKLGDLLGNYDLRSTLGIPSDVPAEKSDVYAALDQYANTNKPLVLLVSGEGKLNDVFDLLCFLHGDISSRPFCIPYVNPITPLVMNGATTDKMMDSFHRNLPVIYSNYGMYGGTTPQNEAGSLALLNAELLAGLVFAQLIKEGSQVILGSLPAAFNMENMGSGYTPGSYLINLACAEMMAHYGIPHCGTSGSGNGRGADLIASGHLWLNHLSSCVGKVGCVPFVGGNFDSMVFSPATIVLSNQIIGEARRFSRGFSIDDGDEYLKEIALIGHGGDYLTSEYTLAGLDKLRNNHSIWSSLDLETWKKQDMPGAEQELKEMTRELYSGAVKASEENLEIIKKGEAYIESK